jgi:hypothetical protein
VPGVAFSPTAFTSATRAARSRSLLSLLSYLGSGEYRAWLACGPAEEPESHPNKVMQIAAAGVWLEQ